MEGFSKTTFALSLLVMIVTITEGFNFNNYPHLYQSAYQPINVPAQYIYYPAQPKVATTVKPSYYPQGKVSFGKIGSNDRIIYSDSFYLDSGFITKREKLITIPSSYKNRYTQLTAINVTDTIPKANNGEYSIIKGGPLSSNATLRFKSQRSKSMGYKIDFFGH